MCGKKMDEKSIDQNREITIPVSEVEEEKATENNQDNVSASTVDEYIDQLQRLQAEFSNYKKRVETERKSFFSIAKSELIFKLLPVLDDFDRMANNLESNGRCDPNVIQSIHQNLKKCLVDEGLEEIVTLGEPFDPHIHEAAGVEETDENGEGFVVEEWKRGYTFGGKLLRPSQVKVGKSVKKINSEKT